MFYRVWEGFSKKNKAERASNQSSGRIQTSAIYDWSVFNQQLHCFICQKNTELNVLFRGSKISEMNADFSGLFITNHLIIHHPEGGKRGVHIKCSPLQWCEVFCLKSGLFVLHAGWPAQPGGEALCSQSLRADAHAGAHASRDAQASVRMAAVLRKENLCLKQVTSKHTNILLLQWINILWFYLKKSNDMSEWSVMTWCCFQGHVL